MTDVVRKFLWRLSPEAVVRLFTRIGLFHPDVSDLGPLQRTKAVHNAVLAADDAQRGRAEGIAGHVIALAEKGDLAERALRAICEGDQVLLDVLEEERSLEERIFDVWLRETKILDKARNLAMGFAWRGGRFHCGFTIINPQQVNEQLNDAITEIREIVQSLQGGRKAHAETFIYQEMDYSKAPETAHALKTHHIAIYLETPASYLMEFKEGESGITPVLRREAREMAIDYNPANGRLDVTGKGVGGSKVLQRIAQQFRVHAVAGASMTELERPEWSLDFFLRDATPSLSPPEGFSSVRVSEIALCSQRNPAGSAVFRGSKTGSAYERMAQMGVKADQLSFEMVRSVTLTFEVVPEDMDQPERLARVTLSWPNATSFDGASVEERRVIETWLKQQNFAAQDRQQ